MDSEQALNIVTVGHVDHGKSTVVGRLLADANGLPEGKLEAVKENCRRNAKPFEYAFLLDALKNEQDQGITIDTARCFFHSDKRSYIIIDSPGHIEFLKNMVTGASRAEAALMVIDAARGVEENTRRHGYFLSMLGIKQVSVLVNKMDLVQYSERVFRDICEEFQKFLDKIEIHPASYIPVSGMEGDNIAAHSERMSWYHGMTMLEQMDAFKPVLPPDQKSFRMPVQGVYKFTESNDSRRIIAGSVESGSVKAGDEIVFYPSGKKTAIKSLETFHAPAPEKFTAGNAAGFTMTQQIFVHRGEIVCRQDEPAPQVGVRLRANVFWLGKVAFDKSRKYYFKCGTAKVEMTLERIDRIVNAATLSAGQRQYCERNEVCECVLLLEQPVAFDLTGTIDATSRFVIVDDYEIAGGGIITEALDEYDYDTRNIRWVGGSVTAEERLRMTGHRGMVAWMSGLSGSGKTTIAQEVERRLLEAGYTAYILDGDKMRRGLCSDLGFSDADRTENIRRVAETANLLRDAGIVTIVTLISPFAESRREARHIIGEDFMEIYVKASVETCRRRDPKNLYHKALEGNIKDFTGLTSPYEEPENPDLLLDTELWSEEECVEIVTSDILSRLTERDASFAE